jgi:hypothetical protein
MENTLHRDGIGGRKARKRKTYVMIRTSSLSSLSLSEFDFAQRKREERVERCPVGSDILLRNSATGRKTPAGPSLIDSDDTNHGKVTPRR